MIKLFKILLKVFIPIVVIAISVYMAIWLVQTRPTAERSVAEENTTSIEIMIAEPTEQQIVVDAGGTVIPSKSIELQPEVSGRIIKQNPELIPGGLLAKGDLIAQIDPRDYEYIVEQRKANVEQAKFNITEEQGRQIIAQKEWNLFGEEVKTTEAGRELALRKPHLKNAQAQLKAAQISLEDAKLDLERTKIHAPFNALVQQEHIDEGQLVTPQTILAKLVGTDRYWIKASVRMDELEWISVPVISGEEGSLVRVVHDFADGNNEKIGRVIRLLGDLETEGRMAQVLIAVDDPLNLESAQGNQLPLLLNTWVHVHIEGEMLKDVFVLPENVVHEGNEIWIMDEMNRLDIRKVTIKKRRQNRVIVSQGLNPGDRIVSSRIPTPIPGMQLKEFKEGKDRLEPLQVTSSNGSIDESLPEASP